MKFPLGYKILTVPKVRFIEHIWIEARLCVSLIHNKEIGQFLPVHFNGYRVKFICSLFASKSPKATSVIGNSESCSKYPLSDLHVRSFSSHWQVLDPKM